MVVTIFYNGMVCAVRNVFMLICNRQTTLACYVSSASQGFSLVVNSPSTTFCGGGCSCFVDVCQTTTAVHHIGRSVGLTLHTLVDDRHVAAGLEQSTYSANIKCGQQSGSEPSLREERWTRV